MVLERATYLGDSAEHGIQEGDRYQAVWCCKTADNVWQEDEEPPCSVCPNNLTLTEKNLAAVQAFKDLDTTGRDLGFDIGYLREEAIDCYLRRNQTNTPEIYSALVTIDREVTSHRKKENERKRDLQKKKSSVSKPSTTPRRRSGKR